MIKSFAKSPFAAFIASMLVTIYIWLMRLFPSTYRTSRDALTALSLYPGGIILAFWHDRLALTPILAHLSPAPFYMLVSDHRDGDIVAQGAKVPNLHYIRGSAANPKKIHKEKSGTSALVQMIAALKAGHIVGMTPDGPRGPSRTAKIGIIKLAAHSGAPIIPIGLSASNGLHLGTWDRFFLMNPLSRKQFHVAHPIFVDQASTPEILEEKRLELEVTLNEITLQADKKVGKTHYAGHTDLRKQTG